MKARILKKNKDGIVRLETSGEIKEIEVRGDLFSSKSESISLFFRGRNSSGIIDLTKDEADSLWKELRKITGLVSEAEVYTARR